MMGETRLIPTAGYIRESTRMQRKGFGADVQRKAIEAYASTVGCEIVMWREDTEKGRVITREGYQDVLEAVKRGTVHAVIVNMFDRAGRDGVEFLQFARELERKRVPFYSVLQGRLQGEGMPYVHALLSENEVRVLARRVRPAKEASVRAGNHNGVTPFGYTRPSEVRLVDGKRMPRPLMIDEPAAAIVRELFAHAAQGWSLRALALWMNGNPDCPPPPKAAAWTATSVYYILRNPVYYGHLSYNKHRVGYYDTSPEGSDFIAKGTHDPIINKALFDQVQDRLDAAQKHKTRARLPGPVPLAAGVLRCAHCGGPMTIARYADQPTSEKYMCSRKYLGATPCESTAYLARLAHEALLAQIDRLQGHPWQPQALERIVGTDPQAEERSRLTAQLRGFETAMARHVERFASVDGTLTDEMLAAFRTRGENLTAAIKEHKAALAALPVVTVTPSDLEALHAELANAELGALVRDLIAVDDDAGARALLLRLVDRARVVERVPSFRSRWLRVEVTWTPKVQLLLDAGLLTLAPDVARPDYPEDPIERRHIRQKAYRERKKSRANGG